MVGDCREKTPGPGTYSVDQIRPIGTAGPSFSMGMRTKLKAGDNRRGPGSYNPVVSASGPAFSMGSRAKPTSQDTWGRGPGSYDVYEANKRGPFFSFGMRGSDKIERSTGPGPGAYNAVNTGSTKTAAPSFSMGGRSASSYNSHGPGPGAYNIPRNLKTGPSFSISSRTSDLSSPIPVPGAHRRSNSSPPSLSMGSNTLSNDKSNTPGPGTYNTDVRSSGPSYSITSKGSKPRTEKDLGPGPGAYDISTASSGPSFTMAYKRRDTT